MKYSIIPLAICCNESDSIRPKRTFTFLGFASSKTFTPDTFIAIVPNSSFAGLKCKQNIYHGLRYVDLSTYMMTFSKQSSSSFVARAIPSSSKRVITLIVICNLYGRTIIASVNPSIPSIPSTTSCWKLTVPNQMSQQVCWIENKPQISQNCSWCLHQWLENW